MTSPDINAVLEQLRQGRVRFVHIWFSDILGNLKSITLPSERLPRAFEEGIAFDGSAIEGFARTDESDMLAWPDPATIRLLPGAPGEKSARMFADIRNLDGTPFAGDPRHVLKRARERLRKAGFTSLHVAPEVEYFYFRSPQNAAPLDRGGYFDAVLRDEAIDLRRETVLALEEMGIPVDLTHHEGAASQHEIDLSALDTLEAADAVITQRFVTKEIANLHQVHASFMPKPLNGQNGSGLHLHLSLLGQNGVNAFFDPKGRWQLSETCRRFIAGILRHARELCLVTNPTINSYKRLVPGYEAPVYVTWARRNRADLIRVAPSKPGHERDVRVEFRGPDPSCNPYLALAAVLSAGLEGIEQGYDVPAPVEENVYDLSPARREELGIRSLPGSLVEAIREAEGSDLLRRTLGEHVFTSLLESKRIEWEKFRTWVTEYERETYLPIL